MLGKNYKSGHKIWVRNLGHKIRVRNLGHKILVEILVKSENFG